jgi:FkbM family methyltransferase
VPLAVREQFWQIRKSGIRPVVRNAMARMRVRLRQPVASVSLEGFQLYVDLRDDGVGLPIYCRRTYEPVETAIVRAALKPGMTAVDIGANVGYFTVLAAGLVGERGKVVAIEPDPHNFSLLARNIRANGLSNVIALNLALGAAPGSARLFCSNSNFGDHRLYTDASCDARAAVEVPMDTLDNVLSARGCLSADFVKMDVQGYEHSVLRGMTATLAANPGIRVLTEFWPLGIEKAGGSPEEFFQTFAASGLSAAIPGRDGTLPPVRLDDVLNRIAGKYSPDSPDGAFVNLLFQGSPVTAS